MNEDIRQKNVSLGAKPPSEPSFLIKLINRFEKIVFTINVVAHKISSFLLFSLMCLTAIDVMGRNIFNKPITGAYELSGLLLVTLVFFSLGMTQLKGDHIEIDFLTNKLPIKVQAVLSFISSFVLFLLLSLTTWQLLEYTKRVWLGEELTGYLGWPLYIFVILAMIGAFLFTLTFLYHMLSSLQKVVQKYES